MMHLLKPALVPADCVFDRPVVRWEDFGLVRVVQPIICTWSIGGKKCGRRIEAGYVCDGPSIPKRFRDVVDWWALLPAALGHDWDYESKGGSRTLLIGGQDTGVEPREVVLTDWYTGKPVTRTREECDHIFYGFALQCTSAEAARLAFYAVRLFGATVWED